MNKEQSLSGYILLAFIIHVFAFVSLHHTSFVNDISKIGDSGMEVQMIFLQKKVTRSEETFSVDPIKKKEVEIQKENKEIIMDNRKIGESVKITYNSYQAKVRQIIDGNKKYPLISRQRRQEGTVIAKFTILKNGTVDKLILRSSGYRGLDREARRMIMASSPFPPIPDNVSKSPMNFTVPINFTLNTY